MIKNSDFALKPPKNAFKKCQNFKIHQFNIINVFIVHKGLNFNSIRIKRNKLKWELFSVIMISKVISKNVNFFNN